LAAPENLAGGAMQARAGGEELGQSELLGAGPSSAEGKRGWGDADKLLKPDFEAKRPVERKLSDLV
jgi:hypothetical protein